MKKVKDMNLEEYNMFCVRVIVLGFIGILTCFFCNLAFASNESISWKFDDTPTIEEYVQQSANTYEVCEMLVPIAIKSIEKDSIYISIFKEVD